MKNWAFCAVVLGATGLVAGCLGTAAADKGSDSATWRHKRSRLLAKVGSPRHSANDVIVAPKASAVVEGKFTYTKASKDLEDEYVSLQIRTKGSWRAVGRALTDSDGRARFTIAAKHLPEHGAQRYRMVVGADRSYASGLVWVIAPGTRAVVFDIDGTLTTADSELLKKTVFGSDVDVRNGAVAVAKYRADQGLMPVYLTGRPYFYNAMTRRWLKKHGFPPGPLITTDYVSEAMPTTSSVGAFKRAQLTHLIKDRGVSIEAAYGNADTDVCAFPGAGIAPANIFIIGSDLSHCPKHAPHHRIESFEHHHTALISD